MKAFWAYFAKNRFACIIAMEMERACLTLPVTVALVGLESSVTN